MATELTLLQSFAQRCAVGVYEDIQVESGRLTARRASPQGFQLLELHLSLTRRSWRLSLRAITALFFTTEQHEEGTTLQFWTSPHLLDPRWPAEWHYLRETDPEPVVQALAEAYEQTLEPHLTCVASPTGLVAFMLETYQPGMFLEPRVSASMRKALLLVEKLAPEQQGAAHEALLARAQTLGMVLGDDVEKHDWPVERRS